MSKWRLFAVVFAATFSLGLIAFFTIASRGENVMPAYGVDFRVLWNAARLPISEIYRPDPHGPFVYPPSAIFWLFPLMLVPFWTGYALWTLASVACFWRSTKTSILAALNPGIVQCLIFGQTSMLIASLLFVFPTGFGLGAMVGLALSIKPQIVFLAPLVFLVRRDIPALLGMAVGFGVPALLSVALWGPSIWLDWLNALPAFRDTIVSRNLFWVFVTPGGIAQGLGFPFLPAWLAGCAVALLAVFTSRPEDDRILIVGASLLAAPYAATHDMAALVPFAFASSRRAFPALTFAGIFPPVALGGWLLRRVGNDDQPVCAEAEGAAVVVTAAASTERAAVGPAQIP